MKEIVIKIPDEAKEAFDNAENNELKGGFYDHGGVIASAIRNGKVLPKGHGRLIDADAFIEFLKHKEYGMIDYSDCVIDDITEDAPTIIEADKGEE